MKKVINIIARAAAYAVVAVTYCVTKMVAVAGRALPRASWKPTGRIMVTGTFHNPNWYFSHITPLRSGDVREVILVIDQPQTPMDGVRFVCPPKWAAKLFSRAGAKAIWMIGAGFVYRPDLYMGYHLAPGGCSALLAARLMGRPACYQMTAGPHEITGGGFKGGGWPWTGLKRPSRLLERLALTVTGEFDLLVVRGSKARDFLISQGVRGKVKIITGSVADRPAIVQTDRPIDMTFVGRLSPVKQLDQFITILAAVKRELPSVKATIVGDGPLMQDLQDRAQRLELTENIEFLGKREDVDAILAEAKVFILPSKTEGLSIAMAEAMAAGAVPVVADVGELGDLVINGVNGYLVQPNNIDEYTRCVLSLLQDDQARVRCSREAMKTARNNCGVDVISKRWRTCLQGAIA